MGLFDSVKAAVGVGAAAVQVAIDETEHAWDGIVHGVVRIRGGEVEQMASEVEVSIREHWTETRHRGNDRDTEHHYRHYSQTRLASGVTVAPQAEFEWPFEVRVPRDAQLSHDWHVVARMSVPKAVDRHGEARLRLYPSPAFLGLKRALQEVAPFELKSVSGTLANCHIDFKPPQELTKVLDGVKFMVREQDDQVLGVLEINPQERSLGDRFKALVKADRIKVEIGFPAAALAQPGPPPAEVVTRLRELLESHLAQ